MEAVIPEKIKEFLSSAVVEFEAGRMMFFYPDYLVAKAWADIRKKIGVDAGIISDSQNKHTRFYIAYRNKEDFKKFIRKTFNNKKFLIGLEKALYSSNKKILQRLVKTDLKTLTDKELAILMKDYYDSCGKLYGVSCILRCVDRGLDARLQELFKNRRDKDKIIRIISLADRPSHAFLENLELLDIAQYIKEDSVSLYSKDVLEKINKLKNSYGWISGGNYKEKAKTVTFYKKELNDLVKKNIIKERGRIEGERREQIEERKEVGRTLNKEAKKLADMLSYSVSLKDDFKFLANQVLYNSELLFGEISRRFGKTSDALKDMSTGEMTDLIKCGIFPHSAIKKRARKYILLGYNNQVIEIEGKSSEDFRRKYLRQKRSAKMQFKGKITSIGRGKGRAKIILGQKDFPKLKSRDIMIVINTTPDFVPLMKGAVAIVAEEGGLTSHASIVSREFKIPCVVGVKNITKIIKDGDLVEVDANKGIVKILKKK